jgi:hypothetical protein
MFRAKFGGHGGSFAPVIGRGRVRLGQQAAEKGVAAALRRHMRVAMIEVVAT